MGKESKKRSIVQPHLILCEGADEWNFLIWTPSQTLWKPPTRCRIEAG